VEVLEEGSRLVSVVPFLFGVGDRTRLPGTALVRLLTDTGASESAARSVLARLRADGGLRSIRRGRNVDYELAGLVEAGFRRALGIGHPERDETAPRPAWSGEFHGVLFTFAEDDRSHRDRLRSAARLAGYAPLRPGLMISPWDGWSALAGVVSRLPESATVYPLALRLTPADARAAAAEAWQLPTVAANTHALIDRLTAALEEAPPESGPAALARYVELALPAYRFFVGIPRLPDELLPADWPLAGLQQALGQVRDRIGLPAEAYVQRVLAGER
jgi:phenylacetic acid degradation operon negative regulatory protein